MSRALNLTGTIHQTALRTPAHPWWQGWVPLLVLPGAIYFAIPESLPSWCLMWSLAGVIYLSCKWLTWRRAPLPDVPWPVNAGYLFAWPGMDAASFLHRSPEPKTTHCTLGEWLLAAIKFCLGFVLFFGVARHSPVEMPYLTGWIGMAGIVTMLHFGLFHLLSCAWRKQGFQAPPIMNRPLTSTSLSEFWGRRWNVAFRDLTYRFLFRPLTAKCGPRASLFIGFLISGLVHDLVISLPARGGYGGPTLFFVIQSQAIGLSRSNLGKKLGLKVGLRGWLFTMTALLAPVGLLFHYPFVLEVILPFMNAMGAI